MPTNQECVDSAKDALRGYKPGLEWEDAVTDLLTDLRHFCAANNLDFDDRVRVSLGHFEEEMEACAECDEFFPKEELTTHEFDPERKVCKKCDQMIRDDHEENSIKEN